MTNSMMIPRSEKSNHPPVQEEIKAASTYKKRSLDRKCILVIVVIFAGCHVVLQNQQSTSWIERLRRPLSHYDNQAHYQHNINNGSHVAARGEWFPRAASNSNADVLPDLVDRNNDDALASESNVANSGRPLQHIPNNLYKEQRSLDHTRNESKSKSRLIRNATTEAAGVIETKGILDLLPWEIQSIRDHIHTVEFTGAKVVAGNCQPPQQIPESCCLGSFSAGGSVTRHLSHYCFKGEEIYNRIADVALQELDRTDAMVDDECDVCRIVDIINRQDLKFAITGDSMMSQNIDGFFCELLRRGYNVETVDTRDVDPEAMVGMKTVWTYEITGPKHWQKPTTVSFHFQYKPHETDMTDMEEIAASHDVLFINFGLHFRTRKMYEVAMANIFNATSRGDIKLLAHRETNAQHHIFTGGEWADDRTACVPLYQNPSPRIGWREKVVQRKAKEFGYKVVVADETLSSASTPAAGEKELVIIPFFKLTAPLHYLHPDECTHFCSTPFLWMPIWRSLRLAMDRQCPERWFADSRVLNLG